MYHLDSRTECPVGEFKIKYMSFYVSDDVMIKYSNTKSEPIYTENKSIAPKVDTCAYVSNIHIQIFDNINISEITITTLILKNTSHQLKCRFLQN